MDFDHRDPAGKLTKMSRLVWGKRERMMEELKKCDLVCAVCHRIRTFTRGLHLGAHLRVPVSPPIQHGRSPTKETEKRQKKRQISKLLNYKTVP